MKYSKIKDREKIANEEVLKITSYLKTLEQRTSHYHLLASLLFYLIYTFILNSPVLLLNAVIFFGISLTLYFRRTEDVRIGGVLTFPLLLYYTLSDTLLPIHFFLVVAMSIPFAVMLMRRDLFGQILFYRLALITLPLTSITYFVINEFFTHSGLIDVTFTPKVVVYMLLPHIYVYNLLRLPEKKIPIDLITTLGLLTFSSAIWVFLLKTSY